MIKKLITQLFRLAMGATFIFSGFVKLVDPVGTEIKMKEYFEVFATDIHPVFEHFIPFSMAFGLLLIILETVMGVAVLVNWRMNLTTWLVLIINVFFTFLTGYSAITNKVTDCGCFGDAIKLSTWETFWKDVALVVLAAWLFWQRKNLKPEIGKQPALGTVVASLLVSCGIAWYAINHLPPIDFRPYHVGANIKTQMEYSGKPIYEYYMEKDGKEYVFDKYPTDTTYHYVNMVLTNPEVKPKITDFSLWTDDGDFTEAFFTGKRLVVGITDARKADKVSVKKINDLIQNLKGTGVEPMAITSSETTAFEAYRHETQLALPYYYIDKTVLEAFIRSDPGVILVKDGTVLGKWHYNDVPTAKQVKALLE